MVGVVAVLTTSSLPRIEGIGIGEGATMSKPTTVMVGEWRGDSLNIVNRAAASSTCSSRSARRSEPRVATNGPNGGRSA
jgi:hypothetical protein